MKIGLMIAISREMEAFVAGAEDVTSETVAGKLVYKGKLEGHELYAVQSGWGEIDAAAATSLLIVKYGCDTVMNFGVVGALETDLRVDDLFVVEKTVNYEFDTSPIDDVVPGQYAEYPDVFIPLDEELTRITKRVVPGIRGVACASGEKFVEQRAEKLRLRAMGCSICDMELAGIARTCERAGVRCLSIKCISDTFDGNGGDFDANVRAGSKKAFSAMRSVLREMQGL